MKKDNSIQWKMEGKDGAKSTEKVKKMILIKIVTNKLWKIINKIIMIKTMWKKINNIILWIVKSKIIIFKLIKVIII